MRQLPPVFDGYEPRKSRVVFVLLAVFLGAFGGHNFYAGYVKKAVIQLCITLFSCFTGVVHQLDLGDRGGMYGQPR